MTICILLIYFCLLSDIIALRKVLINNAKQASYCKCSLTIEQCHMESREEVFRLMSLPLCILLQKWHGNPQSLLSNDKILSGGCVFQALTQGLCSFENQDAEGTAVALRNMIYSHIHT